MAAKFYLLVTGPYDSVFIGPFDEMAKTYWWAKKEKDAGKTNFDFWPMDETEMQANITEFGPIPTQEP
jgi:alpha-glucosidase (family GH31 glycosyl hydrolase)